MVIASKTVNERLALNAGLEYGDKEIDVDFAGVKTAANAGLEYMLTEDVTANANYEYLTFEEDPASTDETPADYSAQKATMGVSVAF
jgi:opacity protein-like surface antigen